MDRLSPTLSHLEKHRRLSSPQKKVQTPGCAIGPTPFEASVPTNLDPNIAVHPRGLGLSEKDMDNMVQFLLALTDDRVACHKAPFDHPSLALPMGETAPNLRSVIANDIVKVLPAVGAAGLKTCFPNTGDLFGTLNVSDSRRLDDALNIILEAPTP